MGYRQRIKGMVGSEYVVDSIAQRCWRIIGFLKCKDGERFLLRKVGTTGQCRIIRFDEIGEWYRPCTPIGGTMTVGEVGMVKGIYAEYVKAPKVEGDQPTTKEAGEQ